MKKYLIVLGVMVALIRPLTAQNGTDALSFEIRYPMPSGDNFLSQGLGKGYSGVIDLGVEYNFYQKDRWAIGAGFNTSLLKLSATNTNLTILSPRIKVDYQIPFHTMTLIPQFGIGYASWIFKTEYTYMDDADDNVKVYENKNSRGGLTLEAAAKMVFNNDKRLKWFVQLAYEYTRLGSDGGDVPQSSYNSNAHIFYPGVGVIWKFKKES